MEAFCPQFFLYVDDHYCQFSFGIFALAKFGLGGGKQFWTHQLVTRNAAMALCIVGSFAFGFDRCVHGTFGGT